MIRLLVVDDSALMRRLLGEVFGALGDFEIAFARDGVEALEQAALFNPDVVTLDVQMPRLDGLEALDRLMLERPCPVVMVSSLTAEGAEVTLQALELGAVDFIAKPSGALSLKMDVFGPELVAKVRTAAEARVRRTHRLAERLRLRAARPDPARHRAPRPGDPDGLVLVGASTGGPPALESLLAPLPADFPWPVVVAQHMPGTFTGPLARRLDGVCDLTVTEVTRATRLEPGCVYIGKGDADVIVARRPGALVALSAPSGAAYRWHPSVDRLVDSAIGLVPPDRLVGVLMTGMGWDGAAAMARVLRSGGRTIAQDEATSVVWGMPGELVRNGGAGVVAPLDEIAARLLEAVGA